MPAEPQQLTQALRYALHIESLLALATLALTVSLLEWIGTLPWSWSAPVVAYPLARAVPTAYLYLVLRKAALTGSLRLPQLRDHRDTWDTLVQPLLALAVVGSWYWAAVLLAAQNTVGLAAFLHRLECRAVGLLRQPDPAVGLALGFAVLYLPPALSASLLGVRLLLLVDPSIGLRLLYSAEARGYLRVYGALCLLTGLLFVLDALTRAARQAIPIPLAAPVLAHLPLLWILLVQARLLGRFLWVSGMHPERVFFGIGRGSVRRTSFSSADAGRVDSGK